MHERTRLQRTHHLRRHHCPHRLPAAGPDQSGAVCLGKPVLPIESQTVEQLVTAGITTVAALVAWWKNNSFTAAAIQADQTYDKLRAQGK